MAHLPVIANVYRCALNWAHSNGQIATNVIHILDESGTVTDAQLRTQLNAAASGNMWITASVNAQVEDLAITKLDGVSGTTHAPPATAAHWTGQNPDPYIPAVACIVKLSTGLRGRSKRGRVFIPFSSTSVVVDGQVNPASAAAATTAWTNFQNTLNAGANDLDLVVASYKLATVDTAIDPISMELTAGTQRRRQGRLRGA